MAGDLPFTSEYTRLRDHVFDRLDGDTKMYFAAAQLLGFVVHSWADILPHMSQGTYPLVLQKKNGNPFFVDKDCFYMMKKLVGASNEDWKFQSIDPSGYLETGETMVGMCDLSAPCYEKCMVFQGKDTLQTEWMFKEYLLSKKHLFSMLEVLTQGENISLNNEVNVRVVLDQSCRLYLVEKKGLHVHVPAPLQTGLTNSTGLQCRIWAHKNINASARRPWKRQGCVVGLYRRYVRTKIQYLYRCRRVGTRRAGKNGYASIGRFPATV